MLKIKGIELDFDITSPGDMLRYKEAGERMEEKAEDIKLPTLAPDDPGFIDVYIDMLNAELRIFGDFIDDVFGDGVAEKLLGNNPSLNRVTEINEELGAALETQGSEFGLKLQKYQPNRATRRTRKN